MMTAAETKHISLTTSEAHNKGNEDEAYRDAIRQQVFFEKKYGQKRKLEKNACGKENNL